MVREVPGSSRWAARPSGWHVPIVWTEASRDEGVEELAEKIAAHGEFIRAEGTLSDAAGAT